MLRRTRMGRAIGITAGLLSVCLPFLSHALQASSPSAEEKVRVVRLPGNPIVTPQTDASLGANINGPGLLHVPAWVAHPLGAYYLYFADHRGKYIRLAYADKLTGPWKIYRPGTLPLEQSYFTDHIASPDVVVDSAQKQIRLYYHGLTPEDKTQHTRVALSTDGLHFTARQEPVGRATAYWRLFAHDGWWYALAMPGKLFRSRDGLTGFEAGPQLFPALPMQVHNAVLCQGDTLHVFYTRAGDRPERLLYAQVHLGPDWLQWRPTLPQEALRPETTWEGADLPLAEGHVGALDKPEHALRDPALFTDAGKTYLLYAIAGESGIAIAEVHLPAPLQRTQP